MSKYSALGTYLRTQKSEEVPLSFKDIERITGEPLPPSAHKHRPWWSNNPDNSTMTNIWLNAGFKTERVDMAGGKLVFRRLRKSASASAAGPAGSTPSRPPMLGALKGLVHILPGTDLAQPADPTWANVADQRK
jgi:hypothetical protein